MSEPNQFNTAAVIMRLSKMNNSINQPDSEALIMITNGSLEILQLISKVIMSNHNKQQLPNIIPEFDNIIKKIKEGFEKYVDLKINKIQIFTEYFRSLNHDVTDEKKDLENFLKIWEPFKLKFHNFNLISYSSNFASEDEIKKFQKEILVEGNPIFNSLKEIENKIERRSKNIIQTAGIMQLVMKYWIYYWNDNYKMN